jgi:hypothetical protein
MEKSIMADVVLFCAWFKFYKKLFDLSPEMTDANANVNAAVQGALANTDNYNEER